MLLPGKAGGRDRGSGWEGVRLIERGLGAAVCLFMCGVAVVGSSSSVAAVKLTADGLVAAR